MTRAISQRTPASQDERLRQIPCPTLRTLVNEGRITPDAQGRVDLTQLDAALKSIGLSGLPRKLLVGGAEATRKDHAGEMLKSLSSSQFNILRLGGGSIDHAGDTQILRKGFSQERLDWLLSFSSDGKGLTLDDLSAAQKVARNLEPSDIRSKVLGMAELTALLLVFGTPNAQGKKALSKESLTSLYKDAKFPEGWKPGETTGLELVGSVAKMAFAQTFTVSGRAQRSLDQALGRETPLDQTATKGLQNAMCPAGFRRPTRPQPVSPTEVGAVHRPTAEN